MAIKNLSLTPLAGDAGFRCYYRLSVRGKNYIVVDAPNDKSNNLGFVAVQQAFYQQKLLVPEILYHQAELGFFCLSDLGEVLFSDRVPALLADSTCELDALHCYYQAATRLLPLVQTSELGGDYQLPAFDDALLSAELDLLPQWLVKKHLNIDLSVVELEQLGLCFQILKDNALTQPQVVVHRDYHSRNLMVTEHNEIGLIDFQDAVLGPISYDIVSLLRDCYHKLPSASVDFLFNDFIETLNQQPALAEKIKGVSAKQWRTWFDLMGVQRHIKAAGIFARLYHRDGKSGYLNDIPLTLSYIVEVSAHYDELAFLHQLVNEKILPAVIAKQLRQDPQVAVALP